MKITKVTTLTYKVTTGTTSIYFRRWFAVLGGIELYDSAGVCGFLSGVRGSDFARLLEGAA